MPSITNDFLHPLYLSVHSFVMASIIMCRDKHYLPRFYFWRLEPALLLLAPQTGNVIVDSGIHPLQSVCSKGLWISHTVTLQRWINININNTGSFRFFGHLWKSYVGQTLGKLNKDSCQFHCCTEGGVSMGGVSIPQPARRKALLGVAQEIGLYNM